MTANLRDDGHVVREYAAPPAIENGGSLADVALVITDYQLDGANGLVFADAVHAANPALPVILVTAYATSDLEAEVAKRPFLTLCRKPVDYDHLHDTIHQRTRSPH